MGRITALWAMGFLAISALASNALAEEVNPMQTSCRDEIVARNMKSVNHWSTNIPLSATNRSQWLMNSDTGYSAKVELNQYEYLKDTGAPAWTIVRFYETPAVDKAIRERKPTPTLQGFSNNLMYVQADGSCYVSEDRFDDIKYYSKTVAYLLAKVLTSQSMGASNGDLPPGVDSLYRNMTLEDLRLPIDAAVQNLIKKGGKQVAADDGPTMAPKASSTKPMTANLCRSPMQRVMVLLGDLKDMNVVQPKTEGNFENYDDLHRFKKPLTALCFQMLDANYMKVRVPPNASRCSFIRGNMECYAD